MHPEQQQNLFRVGGNISEMVLAFCRLHAGREFRMEKLTGYVRLRGASAPDSAGRILRLLRQRGMVEYEVLSRSESLYRVLEVRRG